MTSVVSVYVDPWLCLFLGLKTHSFYQLPKKYLKRLKKQFATAVNKYYSSWPIPVSFKRETDGWCFFLACADYGPLWRPVNFLRLSSFFLLRRVRILRHAINMDDCCHCGLILLLLLFVFFSLVLLLLFLRIPAITT